MKVMTLYNSSRELREAQDQEKRCRMPLDIQQVCPGGLFGYPGTRNISVESHSEQTDIELREKNQIKKPMKL